MTAAVAAGGVVGATARWWVGTVVPHADGGVPWPTLIVNLVGCALLGVVAAGSRPGTVAWGFTATGALGGFTTMSSFAVEVDDLVAAGRLGLVALYVALTLVGGVGALVVAREAAGGDPGRTPPPEGVE